MEKTTIPFASTGYFSKLIEDYLKGEGALAAFYRQLPSDAAFGQQMVLKGQQFDPAWRGELADILKQQHASQPKRAAVQGNLELLESSQTFTVVTGHQLNLFTGPLYFFYKIAHTIVLCRHLKRAYPEHNFVPVYWMATEDHDFEEISFFNLKGKNIRWNRETGGAVGRMSTAGLEAVYETFAQEVGPGAHANQLKKLFRESYLEHQNLAAATRFLVDHFFGDHGLLIVDGDDSRLKARFAPLMRKDLREQITYQQVQKTSASLNGELGYHEQVTPREINYFYLSEGLRERIVFQEQTYHVLETDVKFSTDELEKELEAHPERFSPNVITRPLYQEAVLPNLAYIGGGGELAYWLQLRGAFEAFDLPYPLLCLRNSVLLVPSKQVAKAEKLKVGLEDLFLQRNRLINKKIREISDIDIDLTPLKAQLSEQFTSLYQVAEQTDPTFIGAVKAQEVKQHKGLDALEKRLLKAQKRKLQDHVTRLVQLQESLFPNQGLQERQVNFSEIYLELGPDLVGLLLEQLEAYPEGFTILTY